MSMLLFDERADFTSGATWRRCVDIIGLICVSSCLDTAAVSIYYLYYCWTKQNTPPPPTLPPTPLHPLWNPNPNPHVCKQWGVPRCIVCCIVDKSTMLYLSSFTCCGCDLVVVVVSMYYGSPRFLIETTFSGHVSTVSDVGACKLVSLVCQCVRSLTIRRMCCR